MRKDEAGEIRASELRNRILTLWQALWRVVCKGQVMSVSTIKQQFKAFALPSERKSVDHNAWKIGLPIDYPDRRAWARHVYDATVVTTICDTSPDMTLTRDRELSCQAVDASANGLQLASDLEIPVGAVLDFVVHDAHQRTAYTLTGEVRWISDDASRDPLAKTGYLAGVALYDWYETDIRRWQKRFPA